MKKVSLLTALLVSAGITTASADLLMGGCPKAFQGFHLGANIGYGIGYDKVKADDVPFGGGDTLNIKNKLGVSGVDGGIGTGYTFGCGNWRFGIAFDANWANSSGTASHVESDNEAYTYKSRLKNSLQLYGKTGYVICDKVMPFVGLGWENAKWSRRLSVTNAAAVTTSFSSGKRINALMWKAGVDFLMTKHIIAGLEYTGSYGGRKSLEITDDVSAKFKPQYNKFAATLRVIY